MLRVLGLGDYDSQPGREVPPRHRAGVVAGVRRQAGGDRQGGDHRSARPEGRNTANNPIPVFTLCLRSPFPVPGGECCVVPSPGERSRAGETGAGWGPAPGRLSGDPGQARVGEGADQPHHRPRSEHRLPAHSHHSKPWRCNNH